MKICIVQGWGFQRLHGGNLRVYYLIKELLKRGYEIILVHASKEDAVYSQKEFGCPAISVGVNITRFESVNKKLFKYFSFVLKARKKIRRLDVDVVFGISLINSLVAVNHPSAQSAILYVDFMSNYYKYNHKGIIHNIIFYITQKLERRTIEKADRVAMITCAMKNMAEEKNRDKIVLIPDGADTQLFHPGVDASRIKQKYGLNNDPIVGYQGGIEPFDGLQFLAEAAPYLIKEIPNVRFLIAGKGTYLEKVKDILRRNAILDRFIFTGWIDYNTVPEVLAATTVSVVPIPDCPAMRPLLTFRLLEAMASGTPVVVNDLPGVREMVDEGMSFFTRVEDPYQFADTLAKVIRTDKEQLVEMTRRARKKIETLDWKRIGVLDADFVAGSNTAMIPKKGSSMHFPQRENISAIDDKDPLKYYYNPLTRYFYRKRLIMAYGLLEQRWYDKLLEIGYGSGIFLPALADRSRKLFAIDVHCKGKIVSQMLKKENRQALLVEGDASDISFKDDVFDGLVCISVVEHFENVEPILDEINRILRKDATAIIGFPVKNIVTDFFFRVVGFKTDEIHPSSHNTILEKINKTFNVVECLEMTGFCFSLYIVCKCRKKMAGIACEKPGL